MATPFDAVKPGMRQYRFFSKAISRETVARIENIDRPSLTKQEHLHVDLFLFSYYAGGMSGIDVCHMDQSWIKNGTIEYERIKYPNKARVIISDKAEALIEKYRTSGHMSYVFPVFKKKDMSISSRMNRVAYINKKVNQTLKKICELLEISEKITWSTARSSFISRMVDEGYPVLQICEQTGNSPATIHKHYYAITDINEMKTKMDSTF